MNLPYDISRCRGSGCHERDTCERYRQIGRDEMAPHGVAPERRPCMDSAREEGSVRCELRIEAKT